LRTILLNEFVFYLCKSCRQEQGFYDHCMREKLGIERPPFGYFTQLRVHETSRPKPKGNAPEFKDPTIGLPSDFPREKPIYGWRHWWYS
jgi:NADH dehydrogenase (ubiquinone) 1 alpha subcomplex subunit 8